MSDLINAFEMAQSEAQAAPTQRAAVKSTTIDPARWRELVDAITNEHDGFEPNVQAVRNAGLNGAGQPTVLAALKRDRRHENGSASVVIYAKGTVVWTGIEPVKL